MKAFVSWGAVFISLGAQRAAFFRFRGRPVVVADLRGGIHIVGRRFQFQSPWLGSSEGGIFQVLRPEHTMRTKCAISDAFIRDCVFAYCASVAQYVYSLSAEHFLDYAKTQSRTNASEIAHFVRIV